MTFTVTHTRAITGNDITVTVGATPREQIATVTVTLDGADLEELELASGAEQYNRTFNRAGDAGPGMEHTLVVTATDASGAAHSSTTVWSDSF